RMADLRYPDSGTRCHRRAQRPTGGEGRRRRPYRHQHGPGRRPARTYLPAGRPRAGRVPQNHPHAARQELSAHREAATHIEGVNAAMITPHGEAGRGADFGAALDVVDFLCAAGVRGIVLLGSTGEFLALTFDERVRLTYL